MDDRRKGKATHIYILWTIPKWERRRIGKKERKETTV